MQVKLSNLFCCMHDLLQQCHIFAARIKTSIWFLDLRTNNPKVDVEPYCCYHFEFPKNQCAFSERNTDA